MAHNGTELQLLANPQNGFPGGGNALHRGLVEAGETAYFSIAKVSNPRNGVVLQYTDADGVEATAVPFANDAIGSGNGGNYGYQLYQVSPDGNIMALSGYDSIFQHFVLKAEGSNVEVLARESVTIVPGLSETFQEFKNVAMSPDGSRFAFYGKSGTQEGIYYWHNGTISAVATNANVYPGTTGALTGIAALPAGIFAADGTLYIKLTSAEQAGIFKYTTDGQLVPVFDSQTTTVDGAAINRFIVESETFQYFVHNNTLYFDYSDYIIQYDGNAAQILLALKINSLAHKGDKLYALRTIFIGYSLWEVIEIDLATGAYEVIHQFPEGFFQLNHYPVYAFVDNGVFVVAEAINSPDRIHRADVSDLSVPDPLPQASIYFNTTNADYPYFNRAPYGWFYAPDETWPWVYSYTADNWLYVTGHFYTPMIAWADGIGWIWTQAGFNTWPWYFVYGDTWYNWTL